jgi:hypothetical protein
MRLVYFKIERVFPGLYWKRKALYTFRWCVVGSVPLLGGPFASKDNLALHYYQNKPPPFEVNAHIIMRRMCTSSLLHVAIFPTNVRIVPRTARPPF